MSLLLPDTMRVIERGWLSANSILFHEGTNATLVDSGYLSHAAQTLALVRHALDGRQLKRLHNTHGHSDHIGGSAALKGAFNCQIAVPAGLHARIAEWDENALLLSPLGQQAARFQHDDLLYAGELIEMGNLVWQMLAVPGHDMEALAFYNAERRILISGDALWENGFGVVFPELLGEADGLAATRATLEMLARLPIDIVIPGHGSPFAGIDAAFARAFQRLERFSANIEQMAWNAIKVVVSFAAMERQQIPAAAFGGFVLKLPFAVDLNQRYLGLDAEVFIARIQHDLLRVNALRRVDDGFVAG
jgi:glyoxylase-like metal-dependent hydrolase (beta-lactamase superfamily II)